MTHAPRMHRQCEEIDVFLNDLAISSFRLSTKRCTTQGIPNDSKENG
jgi:hypothetical protein